MKYQGIQDANIVDINSLTKSDDLYYIIDPKKRICTGVETEFGFFDHHPTSDQFYVEIYDEDHGKGFFATKKEFISFILATGIYEEAKRLIDYGKAK